MLIKYFYVEHIFTLGLQDWIHLDETVQRSNKRASTYEHAIYSEAYDDNAAKKGWLTIIRCVPAAAAARGHIVC